MPACQQLFLGHAALWPPHPWSSWHPDSVSCPVSAPQASPGDWKGLEAQQAALCLSPHSQFWLLAEGRLSGPRASAVPGALLS